MCDLDFTPKDVKANKCCIILCYCEIPLQPHHLHQTFVVMHVWWLLQQW